MNDGIGLAERLLGLDGFRVLEVSEGLDELVITIETTADFVGCCGPTEGLNLCVKKVKRCGHGFRTFEHYRLRVLLHAGGVTWPSRPRPPRMRTRCPHPNA